MFKRRVEGKNRIDQSAFFSLFFGISSAPGVCLFCVCGGFSCEEMQEHTQEVCIRVLFHQYKRSNADELMKHEHLDELLRL